VITITTGTSYILTVTNQTLNVVGELTLIQETFYCTLVEDTFEHIPSLHYRVWVVS